MDFQSDSKYPEYDHFFEEDKPLLDEDLSEYELNVLNANICMSFDAFINKWDAEPDLPIDDVCDYLDVLIEVFDSKYTYKEFLEKCNLSDETFTKLN